MKVSIYHGGITNLFSPLIIIHCQYIVKVNMSIKKFLVLIMIIKMKLNIPD